MQMLAVAAAILLATHFVVRSITRGVERIENRVERSCLTMTANESASNQRSVALIAGLLVANRLNSSAHETEGDPRVKPSAHSLTALVSPVLSELADEARRSDSRQALLEREIKDSVSIA